MGLFPPITSDVFSLRENSSFNLRSGVIINRRNKSCFKTVNKIGAILWKDFPTELKNKESLNIFLKKDKALEPK